MSAKIFAKKNLTNVTWPSKDVSKKELWDVSGILKGRSNEVLRFDVGPITKQKDGRTGKRGRTTTTANKMVVETASQWIIVDIEELHRYIIINRVKEVHIADLIEKLETNIILEK